MHYFFSARDAPTSGTRRLLPEVSTVFVDAQANFYVVVHDQAIHRSFQAHSTLNK